MDQVPPVLCSQQSSQQSCPPPRIPNAVHRPSLQVKPGRAPHDSSLPLVLLVDLSLRTIKRMVYVVNATEKSPFNAIPIHQAL